MFVNLEAEQGLLGSLMMKNNGVHELVNYLSWEDFAAESHGKIYKKICDFVLDGRPANPVNLSQSFEKDESLKDTGGGKYLAELVACAVSTSNNAEYARVIRDLSQKRKLQIALREGLEQLETEKDGSEIATDLSQKLQNSFVDNRRARTKTQIRKEILAGLETPKECYRTGLKNLDIAMGGGVYAGWTYGLAGKEKSGKTTAAHTISFNLNNSGVKHAYIALEMGSKQIEERNLSREIGCNSMNFLDRNNRPADFIEKVSHANSPDNTIYLDMPGCSIEEIQGELISLVYKEKIKGFIIDYLQIIGGRHRSQTEEAHYREIAQSMSDFARRHGVFNIMLAQLNKDGDLFMGGGLKKACDQLYFIQECDNEHTSKNHRWMKMAASRYTPQADLGNDDSPSFVINTKVGPYFECWG